MTYEQYEHLVTVSVGSSLAKLLRIIPPDNMLEVTNIVRDLVHEVCELSGKRAVDAVRQSIERQLGR
jgi:hypothetical protein